MQTEIYIKTNLFPAYPHEAEEINPGRFGKRLAAFVAEALKRGDIDVVDIYPTDSCYELSIKQFEFDVYVQVGNFDGEQNEFLISIEPKKAYVRKWFKKILTIEAVKSVYESIFKACSENAKFELMNNE